MSHFHPNLHTVAALLLIPLLGLIGISATSAPADGAHPTPWTRCSKAAGDAAARDAGIAQELDDDAFTRSFRLVDASKAPGGGSAARAATTRLITYWPFAQDGSVRPGLKIVRRHGQCWTTPEATVAHRAFRCMAGNYIHDPCFEPPGGLDPNDPSVVCADDPWAHTVIRLHLDHDTEVRAASNADPRLPWAMRLANGQRCLLQQGASMVDGAGRRLNYVCASPSSRRQLWLFGHVDRAHGTWRIRAGEPRSGGDV